MRKKREFTDETFYHVTSRTNDKIRVFENRLGRKIMLMTLQDAQEKYRFCLANFCVMPTHVHLLIEPLEGTSLNRIMQWIKTNSAKRWNSVHGSKDHLWGERYFARAVRNQQEYEFVMNYIDQNPVAAGLAETPAGWKASGAYYKDKGIPALINYGQTKNPLIPADVSRLIPPRQLEHTLRYYGAYAESIDNLCRIVSAIPGIGEAEKTVDQKVYLRYYTDTADYFIYGYDGEDTMFGAACSSVFPDGTVRQKISLANLKKNEYMRLEVPDIM
jgi:REP element-mobilizing transposase RayT